MILGLTKILNGLIVRLSYLSIVFWLKQASEASSNLH